jgi:hypothetical protein
MKKVSIDYRNASREFWDRVSNDQSAPAELKFMAGEPVVVSEERAREIESWCRIVCGESPLRLEWHGEPADLLREYREAESALLALCASTPAYSSPELDAARRKMHAAWEAWESAAVNG